MVKVFVCVYVVVAQHLLDRNKEKKWKYYKYQPSPSVCCDSFRWRRVQTSLHSWLALSRDLGVITDRPIQLPCLYKGQRLNLKCGPLPPPLHHNPSLNLCPCPHQLFTLYTVGPLATLDRTTPSVKLFFNLLFIVRSNVIPWKFPSITSAV